MCVTVVRAPSVYILEGTGRQKCSHCKVNVYIVIVVVMCTILDSAQDHKIIAAQDSSTKFDVLRAYQDDTSGFHHGPFKGHLHVHLPLAQFYTTLLQSFLTEAIDVISKHRLRRDHSIKMQIVTLLRT